jgi:hypothetical protein
MYIEVTAIPFRRFQKKRKLCNILADFLPFVKSMEENPSIYPLSVSWEPNPES